MSRADSIFQTAVIARWVSVSATDTNQSSSPVIAARWARGPLASALHPVALPGDRGALDALTLRAKIVSVLDDERVRMILDAAYTCFTRHGIRRTTMDDIAREAGMSRPAVYQYVRNKEDAFRRLAERLLDEALTGSRRGAQSPGGLADRLTAALAAKLDLTLNLWRDSPAHAAELLGDNARLSTELIAAYDVAMRDLLAETVGPLVPRDDAVEFAQLLLAFTRGLEADLSDPTAPPRRLRHGVALFVAGLNHQRTDTEEL